MNIKVKKAGDFNDFDKNFEGDDHDFILCEDNLPRTAEIQMVKQTQTQTQLHIKIQYNLKANATT